MYSVSWLFLLGWTGKIHLLNKLWCVDGDIKPYSLTQFSCAGDMCVICVVIILHFYALCIALW